jgi:hypothetical protein
MHTHSQCTAACLQLGNDPAGGPRRRSGHRVQSYNFPFQRYAAHPTLLTRLRACATIYDLRPLLRQLRDEGVLASLARAGAAAREGAPAPAGSGEQQQQDEADRTEQSSEEEEQEEEGSEEKSESEQSSEEASEDEGGGFAMAGPPGGSSHRKFNGVSGEHAACAAAVCTL